MGSEEPDLYMGQSTISSRSERHLRETTMKVLLDMVNIVEMEQAEVRRALPATGKGNGQAVGLNRSHP